VAVVLGNPSPRLGEAAPAEDVDAVTRALDDPEPLVREHAAWALVCFRERSAPTLARRGKRRLGGCTNASLGSRLPLWTRREVQGGNLVRKHLNSAGR
jgi:hypothetical protein